MRSQSLKDYARRWITIRDKPGPVESAATSLLCIGLVLVTWHLLTVGVPEERVVDPITLPSLGDTFRSFHSLWFERELSRSAVGSLGRVVGGFFLAAIIGVPLGLAAGSFLRLNAFLKPFSIFGRNIPIAALIPLTLIWFGIGETQKVMFIFLACVAFVFFDSVNAVQEVPNNYLDAAYTLGARFVPRPGLLRALLAGVGYAAVFLSAYYFLSARPVDNDGAEMMAAWRTRGAIVTGSGFLLGVLLWFPILAFQPLYKVLLPLAMPGVTNSLRLLFGLAFGYIMLAEVINAKFGIGYIINQSQRQGPREHIYLALILIALLAFGIDRGILAVQRWFFPYRQMGEH
ncbi:MAG TPA: ABC transporter permease subunit [Candidatus Sumerlaeota bacterium]|nr:ABC transporter permease subunit [Candidatus Sumerlaeota bacterium]HPS01615.1 ABC transporter permease subunit [Candidatus Sumerlaeota bacterium]